MPNRMNLLLSKYWWSWMKVHSYSENMSCSITIFAKISQLTNDLFIWLSTCAVRVCMTDRCLMILYEQFKLFIKWSFRQTLELLFNREMLSKCPRITQKVAHWRTLKLIKFLQIFTKWHLKLWNMYWSSASKWLFIVNRLQFVFANNQPTESHIFVLVDADAWRTVLIYQHGHEPLCIFMLLSYVLIGYLLKEILFDNRSLFTHPNVDISFSPPLHLLFD